MKFITTNKVIRQQYNKIYSIGYCGAYYLLQGSEPIAYTSGVYGWNADIYDVDGVALVTGYRPIGVSVNYELLEKYENKAKVIYHNWGIPYEKRKKKINKLLTEFINNLEG